MITKNKITLYLIFFIVIGCTGQTVRHEDYVANAEKAVLSINEVQQKQKFVDSISNNLRGLSFITDSVVMDSIMYYIVNVGYSSELHRETYYIFYVEKGNTNNIKIDDPISGEIISLDQWRREDKLSKSNDSIDDFYLTLNQEDLPLEYSFEFIVNKPNFKKVPSPLCSLFNIEHCDNYQAKRLPVRKDIKPILLSAENESGDTFIFLCNLSEKNMLVDLLPVFYSNDMEVDGNLGSHVVEYLITEQYDIILKDLFVPFASEETRILKEEKYNISDSGKFIKESETLNDEKRM